MNVNLAREQKLKQGDSGRTAIWRSLVSVAVGLALLGWLLSQIDLKTMLDMLAGANAWLFVCGGGGYLLGNLARSYRFIQLAHLPARQTSRMMIVVLAMSLANQILPARLGELSYIYLARKSQNLPVGKGLVSLLVARLFDLLTIGLLFVAGTLLLLDELPPETSTYVWVAVVSMALVVAVIIALALWRRFLCRAAGHLLERPLLARLPGRPRLARLVKNVEASLDLMGNPLQYVQTLFSSLAVWLSNFGMLYILLLSLGISVTFGQTVIGASLAALTSVLPINSIGSFGTLEAGWTAGFVLAGMDANLALTTGFATHLLALSYAVVFGLLAWGWVLWAGRKSDTDLIT